MSTQGKELELIRAASESTSTSTGVMDDWDESDRAKVNTIVGQAGVAAGAGAVGATVQRTTLASDDPAVVALQLIDDAVFADDAAFTPATSKVVAVGAMADETSPDSVNEGDIGALRMTLDRLLKVQAGGLSDVIQVRPTISTLIYAANDIVGGLLTLTNAVRSSGSTALLESICIFDEDNEKAALEIVFFNANPTASTTADQGGLTVHAGDVTKVIGRVTIAAADYVTVATGKAIAQVSGLARLMKASGSANLYCVVLATGTPTYTGADDLIFNFGFLQDH